MPAIEPELSALKDNLLDMLSLVITQIEKCRESIKKNDKGLAEEIISDEKKVNALEIAIDRDCESILALHTPVATDLRLVLATLKITNDLERIGDNAKSLARFLKKGPNKNEKAFIKAFEFEKMLELLTAMLKDMRSALKNSDTKEAIKAAKRDEEVNDINKKAMKTVAELIKQYPDDIKELLTLFMLIKNLERAGDLTKNIAEELVFQIEARVMKHQKER
jgi:phosphate transport system protein